MQPQQSPLPNEYLEEVRKRCEAATPGPWISYWEGRDCECGESFIRTNGPNVFDCDLYIDYCSVEDQDFIAHARQDIPHLLGEIAALQGLLEEGFSSVQMVKHKLLSKMELNRIRKRCEEATPGPWTSLWVGRDLVTGPGYIMRGFYRSQNDGYQKGKDLYIAGISPNVEDQDFIAHARQDIPCLLYEVARLRKLKTKKS